MGNKRGCASEELTQVLCGTKKSFVLFVGICERVVVIITRLYLRSSWNRYRSHLFLYFESNDSSPDGYLVEGLGSLRGREITVFSLHTGVPGACWCGSAKTQRHKNRGPHCVSLSWRTEESCLSVPAIMQKGRISSSFPFCLYSDFHRIE